MNLFPKEGMNGGCRWRLFSLGWFGIYLHHFVRDDWFEDMHDHECRMVSIGIRGSYREETPDGSPIYRAPWIRWFPATHTHRITMVDKGTCWTIVIFLKPVREWGFLTRAGWLAWHEHQKLKRE